MKRFVGLFLIILFLPSGLAFATAKEVKYVIIKVSAANIREKPTTKASILTIGRYGDRYPLVEDLGPWLKIKLPDGRIGFVWTPLTRVEGEKVVEKVVIKKVPVPQPQPKPQPKPKPKPPEEKLVLPPTAKGKIQLGKRLYYEKKYEKALKVLEKAVADAALISSEGERRQRTADAYFVMGLCKLALGDRYRAKKFFKKTVRLVPDYTLIVTSGEYDPSVVELWKEAEAEVEDELVRERMRRKY